MQDRFKLQVWSVKQNKMYYWSDIIKIHNFGYALFVDNRALGEGIWIKRQSTGLKDKNGKLIYEGDIVKDVNTGCVATIEYLPYTYSLMVHIRRMDDYITIEDICFTEAEGTPFEVIGNIYENPELLEVEQ